ncbi:MAG: alpha/beta hydrolase [Candidatus Cryptobacteroides sp.]
MNRIPYIFILLSLLAASAVGCGSKTVLPEPGPFQRYTENCVMHSSVLGRDVEYAVLLPRNYRDDVGKSYPVVYMLHGYGDNHTSWNGKYLHAKERIEALEDAGMIGEMIYVFPDGYTSYYCNYYTGKFDYMDMFVTELVPLVDRSFRTVADRDHRALTGYSMGGFGAMVLAMKHPEVFSCSAPLSMSFRTDAQYMTESAGGWDGQWGSIFGGVGLYGQDRLTPWYIAHNPYRQFNDENRTALSSVHWFFTCGDDEEQLLVANDSLHVILRDRSFAHEYRVANGAHTSSYWMDALNEVLPWMDHYLNGSDMWPECSRVSCSPATVGFEEDGTAISSSFKENGGGQGVFWFHKGLPESFIRDAIGIAWTTSTKAMFIYLPCDLDVRSVPEWIEYWNGKYSLTTSMAVSIGEAGSEVSTHCGEFSSFVFIDSASEIPEADSSNTYFIALTDESPYYTGADNLYRSCKRWGAGFEYRVIDASDDVSTDRLRCLSKIAPYISYYGI